MESIEKIQLEKSRAVLDQYRAEDVAGVLFALCAWNRNRTSEVRQLWLWCIFQGMSPQEFSNKQIDTYPQAKEFCESLISSCPDFIMFEDYPCLGDWGEIRYHFDKHIWKTFFGTNLSLNYDFMKAFEFMYTSFDSEFKNSTGRSPIDEFRQVLVYTEAVINNLSDSTDRDVDLRNFEVPPPEFFKECQTFVETLPSLVNSFFIISYSRNLGEPEMSPITTNSLVSGFIEGTRHNFLFVKVGEKYFPTIPRRTAPVLIETWSNIAESYQLGKKSKGSPGAVEIGMRVARYVKDRVPLRSFFSMCSLGEFQKRPNDFVFPFAILESKSILLFAFVDPFSDIEVTEQLETLAEEFNETQKLESSKWALQLHLESKQLVFKNDEGILPDLKFIVIVPSLSGAGYSILIPTALHAEVWPLEQFLMMVDEIADVSEFTAFVEFLEDLKRETKINSMSTIDSFAAFRDSKGVLIEGAQIPTILTIDPHWATATRYETLRKFWDRFPSRSLAGTDPRGWEVGEPNNGCFSLVSRQGREFMYSFDIGNITVFVTAPMAGLAVKEKLLLSVAMQALSDALLDYRELLSNHNFFKNNDKLVISFISSIYIGKPNFEYIGHVTLNAQDWIVEAGKFSANEWGLRFVINLERVYERQRNAVNRVFDIQLLKDILHEIEEIESDSDILSEIFARARVDEAQPARYTVLEKERTASFPLYQAIIEPTDRNFKIVRKKIARLAKIHEVQPGRYALREAKEKLNLVLKATHDLLLSRLGEFKAESAIPMLVSNIDALVSRHEITSLNYTQTLGRAVDFVPEKLAALASSEFTHMHKNYRLLIEGTVLLGKSSGRDLNEGDLKELLAIANWFQVFSGASDQIHYQLDPVGVEITDGYLVNVDYDIKSEKKVRAFSEHQKRKELGLAGILADKVESPTEVKDFLNSLDQAFMSDLGFGIRTLVCTLQVLSHWPQYAENQNEEKVFYTADEATIVATISANIEEAKKDSVRKALDFLTLKSENILKIIGDDGEAHMIPVWEHFKRHSRYNIRPLIYLDGKYTWGAHSADRAAQVWISAPRNGKLPINLESNKIKTVLSQEKKALEDELVVKAAEIVRRHSVFVEVEVRLHKREKTHGHPESLGDYDVLFFLAQTNVLYAVECKHLLQVHSLKDAASLREDIFGSAKRSGYAAKIEERTKYLSNNIEVVFKALNWSLPDATPKVKSVYVSIFSYFWTFSPPVETEISFVEIEMFNDFIESELESTESA